MTAAANVKHGHARGHPTKTYSAWTDMRTRCANVRHRSFERYGGRGIKVCTRWNDFASFLEDMGEAPRGMTLDRIDNDGNYEPGNCRWATRAEQARNFSRNVYLERDGYRRCLAEWERELGLTSGVIQRRLARGWSVVQALVPPLPAGKQIKTTGHRLIEYGGVRQSIRAWERQLGLGHNVIAGRLRRGCSIQRALLVADLRRASNV